MAQISKMSHQKQDLFNSLFSAASNNKMEDNNVVQPKIEKHYKLSESVLEAVVDKLLASYKRIEDGKSLKLILLNSLHVIITTYC